MAAAVDIFEQMSVRVRCQLPHFYATIPADVSGSRQDYKMTQTAGATLTEIGFCCRRSTSISAIMGQNMEITNIPLAIPENCNIIVGQSHFIKTAEDLYELIATTCSHARFGVAFCEASGPCLIRVEGNDDELKKVSAENAMSMGAGHTFVILIKNAYPINILNAVKACPEVCAVFCATANPLEAIIAETDQGRGILGVVDGFSPKGVETEGDIKARKEFLRAIGYKR